MNAVVDNLPIRRKDPLNSKRLPAQAFVITKPTDFTNIAGYTNQKPVASEEH
jgi:hypothetical protein